MIISILFMFISGQGHFTEVYNGLLLEQHQVVVKKMRVKDIEDEDFRLVQEVSTYLRN